MPDPTFRIVFKGELIEGYSPATVRSNLAETLSLEKEKVEKLFSGNPVLLKKNASRESCDAITAKFTAAGARCTVIPEATTPAAGAPPSLPPPLPEPESAARMADERFCDNCGAAVKLNALACPYCRKKFKTSRSMPGCAIAGIIAAVCMAGIAILGILAAIAIPNFIAYRDKAKAVVVMENLETLAMAQENYYHQNRRYADNIDDLPFPSTVPDIHYDIVSADATCFRATGFIDGMDRLYWIDCEGSTGEEPRE